MLYLDGEYILYICMYGYTYTYTYTYYVRPPRYLSWFITPITMVYGTYNELVIGAYRPINITGGPHIVFFH